MAMLVRAVLAVAVLVLLLPAARAQQLPRGSYLRTCPEASAYRNRLTAVCRGRDGQWRQTTLANIDRCVGDIANVDGRLRCNYAPAAPAPSLPGGSYQQSCTNIGINGNMLTATCRTMKGRMQRTSLANVDRCAGDIGNNNGRLNCTMR
jgi:hypothetical protein